MSSAQIAQLLAGAGAAQAPSPVTQALSGWQALLTQHLLKGQSIPNNFDQMAVPPYGWPNDRNTYDPQAVAPYLNEMQRRILAAQGGA